MIDDPPGPLMVLPPNLRALARDAGRKVETGNPDFLPSVLCQVGLPRSRQPGTFFERTSGAASIAVEAGRTFDGKAWVQQPLPFGVRPRLALVHIATEAVRTQSPRVDIGDSVHAFLKRLGMDTSGPGYAQFRRQMTALAVCTLRLGRVEHDRAVTVAAQPFAQFEAWLDCQGDQRTLWPAELVLTAEFYEHLVGSAVPLDHNALASLSHSALALDLYTWLAHRLCRIRKGGTAISWASLQAQFGGEYADRKSFKREFKKRLRQVLAVYPDARLDEIAGGLRLIASPSPVPRPQTVVHKLDTGLSGS